MRYALTLLLLFFAGVARADYTSADAKWDHKYISEDFAPAATQAVNDEVGSLNGTSIAVNTDVYDVADPFDWIPYSLDINGVANRVVNLSSAWTATDGTVFFRVKRTSTSSNDNPVGQDATGTQYIQLRNDQTTLRLRVNDANSDATHTACGTTWHSYAVTRNGTTGATKFYFDGSLLSSTTHEAGSGWSLQSIGDGNNSSRLVGEICDVCFADEILTDTDIADYHAGPSAPSGSPLLLQLLLGQ